MSANGIARETVPAGRLRLLSGPRVGVRQAERTRTGYWVVTCQVALTLGLPDGRRVSVLRDVRLRGKQVGRRPYGSAAAGEVRP